MRTTQYLKTFLLGFLLLNISLNANTQAALSLALPQKPDNIVTVVWQGPNQPQDQIVYSFISKSGEVEPISFVYTMRGNKVIFDKPENQLIELSYKSYLKGILAILRVDCRSSALTTDGLCKVLDQK